MNYKKSIPIRLGNRNFPSKKCATEFIKSLLKLENNTILGGDNFKIVEDLIYRHPNAAEKIGNGIKNIWVKKCKDYGNNNQFIIERNDGTLIDFSYKNCLNQKMPTFKNYFDIACRNTVEDQIIAFREKEFYEKPIIICPFTNEILTRENSHVDHAPPNTFAKIVADFIAKFEINIFNITVAGNTKKYFVDPMVAGRFKLFHHSRACLRIISIYANTHNYQSKP